MNRPSLPTLSGLSRRTALGRAVAVGAALGLGSRVGRAAAQDAQAEMAAHPVVGFWQNAVSGPDAAKMPWTFSLYHADGTYHEWNGLDAGAALGIWRPAGERTADLLFVYQTSPSHPSSWWGIPLAAGLSVRRRSLGGFLRCLAASSPMPGARVSCGDDRSFRRWACPAPDAPHPLLGHFGEVCITAVMLESGRLKVAEDLALAQTFAEEMQTFKVTISASGHDSYGVANDWRQNAHDDLLLSVAMGIWWGEQPSREMWRA